MMSRIFFKLKILEIKFYGITFDGINFRKDTQSSSYIKTKLSNETSIFLINNDKQSLCYITV